ncbi:SIR2 family protein [bacterium]|nr:SIR2 family protein [bacterium]
MAIKVAYLFGAGASEGALKYSGAPHSILMKNIGLDIALKIEEKEGKSELDDVRNDLVSGADIEQLITLYEAAGTRRHSDVAKELKGIFREELQKRIKELGDSFFPKLIASLVDMHSIPDLGEELVLILTTNYEDLIEKAIQTINGGINYSLSAIFKDDIYCLNEKCVPVLKLHGSFNWKNEYPIVIQNNLEKDEDTIWIPPGIVKRRDLYPFNIIWGKAKELLEVDILRIIGSSLSRNDWELISLIYSTQKLRTDGKAPYTIEVIDYYDVAEDIKKRYPYLNIKTIWEVDEVQRYITNILLPDFIDVGKAPEEKIEGVVKDYYSADSSKNIFSFWLKAKGDRLSGDNISLETQNNYFKNFILEDL